MFYAQENYIREKIRSKKKISAAWAQAGSNITAEILAEAGFDAIVIDLEHGAGDVPVLISQIQAMKGLNAVPIVRAPWNDFVQIKRILDAGAMGLLVPYVNTKEEAERVVQSSHYPQDGIRGVAGSARAAHYGNGSMRYLSTANKEVFLMVAIETGTGVGNLEQIVNVDGIDGIFIGPNDLASDLGYLCDPSQPEVQQTIKRIEEIVIPSDKILATVSSSFEDAQAKFDRGYDMLMLMSDTTSLSKTARELINRFQALYM